MDGDLMPAAFIGHGNPMNALEHNRYTDAWRALGAAIARPRAVLVVSAHWYINATAVTAMARPRTIHDFYGFPDELFAVRYPAAGDPALAEEVVGLLTPDWVGLDHDSWGLDHGTWSVLTHVFPDADVPVVQLSLNASKPLAYHLELGRRLAPLRASGVLIVASGNIVHNLRMIDWQGEGSGFAWARAFDAEVTGVMTTSPGDLERVTRQRDYHRAVPTPDHFLPLAYVAGLAAATAERASVLVGGCELGSLSMTSYTVGVQVAGPSRARSSSPARRLPYVPPDETNI